MSDYKEMMLNTVDVVEIKHFHAGERYDMSEKRLARVIYASVIWGDDGAGMSAEDRGFSC